MLPWTRGCEFLFQILLWIILGIYAHKWDFQMVKNLPAMWETWVWSLGGEDPLEEGMATHSSILAWRIPGTEVPDGLWSMGSRRVWHYWSNLAHTAHTHIIEYYSGFLKKEILTHATTLMNLKYVLLCEINWSQKTLTVCFSSCQVSKVVEIIKTRTRKMLTKDWGKAGN